METTNSVICDFYAKHPSVNFETVNLMFIKLFETVLIDSVHATNAICQDAGHNINVAITELTNNVLKKGEQGEAKLEHILNNLDTTSYVLNGSTKKIFGDFNILRSGKPSILIESKACAGNVGYDNVDIFINNTKESGYHGIFMSQHSGITSKPNFHIDISNGSILVYVHNVEYSVDKIKTAIDLIDKLSLKLIDLNVGTDKNTITKEALDEINKEYQLFITQKESIIRFIKENQKELLNQIEDMKFSSLDKYLATKFTSVQPTGTHKCNLCNFYTAKSLKGLAAHKRGCKKKHIITA